MIEAVFVTAVSGVSGAGKSSVVERAVELLGNATRLHFDDYRSVSTYPPDLKEWLAQGADLDRWKTPGLARDLRKLRSGESIHLPEDRGIVEPAEFILLEEPFGKLRREMAESIDLAAHLDVPADVLLARRLLRRLEEEGGSSGDGLLDGLRRDLHEYLTEGRELGALGGLVAGEAADLVLDGTKTVDEIAETLVTEIRRRCTEPR